MRLAFCLKDAVPMSAIEAGHVFLGFSKCGQFLLSYTQVSPTQGLHLNRLAPPKLLNSLEVEVHTSSHTCHGFHCM